MRDHSRQRRTASARSDCHELMGRSEREEKMTNSREGGKKCVLRNRDIKQIKIFAFLKW